MAKNKSWRKTCGLSKNQECFNCANRKHITVNNKEVVVTCNIGYGDRILSFSRYNSPFCGAWK